MGDNFTQLSKLVIETDTIQYGDSVLKVSGLTFPQIVYIVRNHATVLEDLYQRALSGEMTADANQIAVELVGKSDTLIAMVVACGLGEPEAVDKAAALPFGIQLEAVDKIVRLTLANEGGLEKTVEVVVRAVAGVANLTTPKT